jgi:hypothetical protein
MDRALRRYAVEVVIRRREKRQDWMGAGGPTQIQRGHRLHKIDGAGACSNRGCWLCAHRRWQKRHDRRVDRHRARVELRRDVA